MTVVQSRQSKYIPWEFGSKPLKKSRADCSVKTTEFSKHKTKRKDWREDFEG